VFPGKDSHFSAKYYTMEVFKIHGGKAPNIQDTTLDRGYVVNFTLWTLHPCRDSTWYILDCRL